MTLYPKIDSVFKRGDRGRFIEGDWARPEFAYLADLPWLWTEKVDGTNIRLIYEIGTHTIRTAPHACVRGRTDEAQLPPKLLNACVELVQATSLETWADSHGLEDGTEVVFYGEGYGAGIQKGGRYRPDAGFVLFDVKVGGWWLRRAGVEDVARELGWNVVGEVGRWTLREAVDLIRAMALGERDKFPSKWPGAVPEGIVGHPTADLMSRDGERIMTKIKFKDWKVHGD